jgi:hypothetical protein
MDAARFATGLTYDAFTAQMTRNQERIEATKAAVTLDPRDVAYFRSLKPIHVAAIVEEWCGDVIGHVPVAAVLADAVGAQFELRVFDNKVHPGLIDRYLNRGRFQLVPVFVVFDDAWREVGVLIERAAEVTEAREEVRREIYAAHPEYGSPDDPVTSLADEHRDALQAAIAASRAEMKPWSDRRFVLALRDAIARAPEIGAP